MEGATITHKWLHNNELKAEKSFEIGGPRWRVHSSKNLVNSWTGSWTVQVVDENGTVLTEKSFVYGGE